VSLEEIFNDNIHPSQVKEKKRKTERKKEKRKNE
jgi:hypothetical protein